MADSGCSGDGTGRKPVKCAEVFLADLKLLSLVVLRKQLTWRSRRYTSPESYFARARLVARFKEAALLLCKTARRVSERQWRDQKLLGIG